MIYSNNDTMAVLAMEAERTGNYGSDYYDDEYESPYCPICGESNPEHFYMNLDDECVGCSECIHKEYELL